MPTGERREPGLVLLYTLLTCGIYYFFWMYYVSDEVQRASGEVDTPPSMEVLLSILTCGLYSIYWDYKMAQKIAHLQSRVGIPPQDNAILYLVLNFIGLGFVPALIEQAQLNDIWNAAGRSATR